MKGLCLDAGALIAIERGVPGVVRFVDEHVREGRAVHVPAAVIAQVWRGGPRQARLSRFLRAEEISVIALDEEIAQLVGILCGAMGTADIVDAHVALHARMHGFAVLTSDPEDLAAYGGLEIVTV
jgi:predicted nucleic acid-binding protein